MTKRRTLRRRSMPPPGKSCVSCGNKNTQVSCNCVAPAVLVCGNCIQAHISSPGTHNISRISQLQQSLKIENALGSSCCHCAQIDAQLICCCQFPPAAVCQSCVPTHVTKPPIALHTPLPANVRDWVSSVEYIEALRKRQQGKEQAKQILLANLAKVDEAEKVLVGQCKWLIEVIKEQQEEAMQELWKIKEDLTYLIKSAVREVEDHIYEDNYAPSNWLATTVWNFHYMPVESELNLFTYQVNLEDIQQKLKEMIYIHLENKGQHAVPPYIPIVNSTSLRKFYFQNETISPPLSLTSPIKADQTTSWLFLDDGRIFACGRHSPPSAATYVLDVSNGNVEEMEPMTIARCQQGMVLFNITIYVFGGLSKRYLSACEKYSIPDGKWTSLPDMLDARDGFNPVCWRNSIYIVGGSNSPNAEVFDPLTETFARLPMQLPTAECSLALVDDGDLVVVQRNAIYRWKLNSAEREYRESKLEGGASWSNATPVVFQHTVYILNCWSNSICKCGLADLSFRQAIFIY